LLGPLASGFAKEGIFYYTAAASEGNSAGVSASTRADVWIEERRITTQHEDIVRLIVQFAAPSCFLLKYKTTLEIIRVGGGGGEPPARSQFIAKGRRVHGVSDNVYPSGQNGSRDGVCYCGGVPHPCLLPLALVLPSAVATVANP
jgi:hypothetical protein